MATKQEKAVIEIARAYYGSMKRKYRKSVPDLAGLCCDVSTALGEKLLKKGFETDLVSGRYIMDDDRDGYHYWLEFNGKVLDLTCEQFKYGVKGKRVYPIFLKPYTKRHKKGSMEQQFQKKRKAA
jgi:hypothetical protein